LQAKFRDLPVPVQGAIAALQRDDDLMHLAKEATSRKCVWYVMDAHVSDFNFPHHRAYSMTKDLFNQVRDGTEEEVALDDIMGVTHWTPNTERQMGELRLSPTPGPIVRQLDRPAPFRPKGDTTSTYVIPPLLMAKMLLRKHQGEHHDLGFLGLLTVLPPIALPAPEQAKLDTLSSVLYDRSRPRMTCRNGVYTPNFNLWSNGLHFAGQNVTSGNGASSRVKSVESLGMETVDLPPVKNMAGVFDEYVRHAKTFGSVTWTTKAAGSENRRVFYHGEDTANVNEMTASIEEEGPLAYDSQVKYVLEKIHEKTLECKGDELDRSKEAAKRKKRTSTKPAPKRRRRVKSAAIVSSSSSSSSSSDEDPTPRSSTCE
jgi:hypothetical protein